MPLADLRLEADTQEIIAIGILVALVIGSLAVAFVRMFGRRDE